MPSNSTELFYSAKKTRPLSRAEERRIILRAQAGDEEAFQQIVAHNVRFVVTVAREYWSPECPFSFEEIVSEGNLGLIAAVHKFNPDRGFKFISYAVWWIRQSISAGLEKNLGVVRRPSGHKTVRQKAERQLPRLTQELGRPPTLEELSEATGVKAERLHYVLHSRTNDASLDSPIRLDNDYDPQAGGQQSFADYLLVDHSSPAALAEGLENRALVRECMAVLSERDLRIISHYYGLGDEPPKTLEAIAHLEGITRERVRQLRNAALDRMRAHLTTGGRHADREVNGAN